MRNGPTFKDVLEAVESRNSRRVIERAVVANAMAKVAQSVTARSRAYQVKTRALEHGVRAFPDDYALASVEDGGRLLGIRFRRRHALHVRAVDLGSETQEWISTERAQITTLQRGQTHQRCGIFPFRVQF
jgi:hypothetical protein